MEKLLNAVYFATEKHAGQNRKGTSTPYITHPLAVGLILSRVTDDTDIIISGILHDVVEDTDATIAGIKKEFGGRIAKLVWECTEEDKNSSWKERKNEVLKKIEKISYDAALIKTADTLHNTSEIIRHIKREGVSFYKHFNATKEEKLRYELERLKRLKKFHPNPLIKDLEKNLNDLNRLIKK